MVADNNMVFFGVVRTPEIIASATALTVNMPAFTCYQPITVTTGGLTAYAKDKFDVTFICGTFTANTLSCKEVHCPHRGQPDKYGYKRYGW